MSTDQPLAGRSLPNRQLRQTAHRRLDELLDDAEASNLFGVVAVEASFEHGRLTTLRRRIDGLDK